MTSQHGVYKCGICGNMVEVVHTGVGALVCCGKEMQLLAENSVDAAVEKHVPVVSRNGDMITVKVGEVPHPMTAEHYIEWIEVMADGQNYRAFLQPGDAPEASFCLKAEIISVREYCNLHGLWKA